MLECGKKMVDHEDKGILETGCLDEDYACIISLSHHASKTEHEKPEPCSRKTCHITAYHHHDP